MRKVLAFDLEITRPLPSGDMDAAPFVGISCCAAKLSDVPHPVVWYAGQGPQSQFEDWPLPAEMDAGQLAEVADFLLLHASQGYEIVTWNGLGFDYKVLARGIGDPDRSAALAKLALTQYDPGFVQVCQAGYMAKLVGVAQGLGVGSKTAGMHGALAPVLWSNVWPETLDEEGEAALRADIEGLALAPGSRAAQDLVLEYVANDVDITLASYMALCQRRSVNWITARGRPSRRPWLPKLKRGAQGVRFWSPAEALHLQEPNTSWMDSPPRPREEYYKWTVAALGVAQWRAIVGIEPIYHGPRNAPAPNPEPVAAKDSQEDDSWPGPRPGVQPTAPARGQVSGDERPRIVGRQDGEWPTEPPPGF